MSVITLMVAWLAGVAQGEVAFESRMLEAGNRVDRVEMVDISGDGKKDLLIQNGHDIHFFIQTPSGFSGKPDTTVRLPANAFLWALGLVGEGDRSSLVVMTSGGALVYPPEKNAVANAPREALIHPQLFEGDSTSAPQFSRFLPDLNGDGRSDIVAFGHDRLSIFLQKGGGAFSLLQRIPIPMESGLTMKPGPNQAIEEIHFVPMLSFGDVNGDGKPDVSYYHEYRLTTLTQGGDGRFQTAAANTTDFSDGRKRRRRFINIELPPQVKDINGDGALDVMTVDPRKGRVKVYYAKRGRVVYDTPDEIRNLNGWSAGCWMRDVNGDGRLDLIATEVNKMGVMDGLKTFLSKKVDVHLIFFPMGADGRLAAEAVQRITFSIPYVIQLTMEEGTVDLVFRPNFDGDYNGDGRKDLLIKLDENALDVYYGAADGGMSGERSRQIAISPPEGIDRSDPFIGDLNGDGVSDIILRHFDIDRQKHHVELLLSKRR